MSDHLSLGRPVGGDDHGAGVGVSGGHNVAPNTKNSQAAMMAEHDKTGFNAGLGGDHASGSLPGQQSGSTGSSHPIADKFMSGSGDSGIGGGAGQGKLDNSLDNYDGNASSGTGAGMAGIGALGGAGAAGAAGLTNTQGAGGGSAVSGAYEGGETRDALTGQSQAFETGPGVGYDGDNLRSSTGGQGGYGGNDLAANTVGRGEGAGPAGATGAAALGGAAVGGAAAGTGHAYGTGVGAEGGAGGHYDPATAGSGKATSDRTESAGTGTGGSGAGTGAAAGAGDAAQGHYGTTEKDFDRGAPLSDPKELDSGGPYSLVMNPETGKYVHRHELDGGALADEQPRPE